MAIRKKPLKVYQENKKKKSVFFVFKFFLACLFLLFSALIIIFIYYAKDIPRPENFLERKIFQSTKIYDRTGKVLLYDIHGEEKREIVPLDQISDYLKKAVIATEDANFYQHYGIDLRGIGRSVLINLKLKKQSDWVGGSTITQQLIRSSLLSQEKTAERKIREIVLSLELDRKYSKEQILEWYLNQVPFGSNAYGAEAASQTFFKKPAKDLSLGQAAILAALIQAPTRLSPYGEDKEALLKRKNYVLDQMEKLGFVTKEEKEMAQKEEIIFSEFSESIKAPHFTLFVKNYLIEKYGIDFLEENGLKVYTSLDWEAQELAEKLVKDGVENNKSYNAYNAALVAINPNNGEILAMVGSADWFGTQYPVNCVSGKNCLFDPKFNVAVGTKNSPGRQPGSAFKPFAYAAAFQKGFTPETILWDVKTEFNPNCSPDGNQLKDQYGLDCYHPFNYTGKFKGPLSLRNSLAQSINVTSVKTLYLVGVENAIKTAHSLGITTLNEGPSRYGLALVLGGGEVKLIDMTSAYGVFATEGLVVPPVSILKIEDSQGNLIEENKKTLKRVLDIQTCRKINDILSDNEARAPIFGLNSPLHFPESQVAVKTGTTQEYRDGWAIGYTPSITVGVWAGNNNNSPMNKEPGVVSAAPIFHKFMEKMLLKYPKQEFTKPEKTTSSISILNGEIDKQNPHSILYYIDKNNLSEATPTDPYQDYQYKNWEEGVKFWVKQNPIF
ncbi:MAG: transglycosylase domain-containing protein [Candidatus Nealsonbacteria bacterium]|nr:transglycosylase domain-containing protein [Candidatus Nealsonbacteria bacterium]